MRHEELIEQNSAVCRAEAMLGQKWVFAILRAAFMRARTFEDYQETTGIARNVLADRLRSLVDFGILEKRPYEQNENRNRSEYRLTEAGIDLYPVIISLMQWGNKHGGFVAGPPVVLRHRNCCNVCEPQMVCSECGEAVIAREMEGLPGPGA